nr:immunoglobulin heavy chain junction region [Macaca mulatta]MOV44825.1 immunoglobulin heavy chain junction region [Macaca mulatta]MOV46723.1 immunoglobulin heavy chain junction region [Macaca mulatta]
CARVRATLTGNSLDVW